MHDGVLDTASGALNSNGYNVLRFNFRGVGASEGSFDQGIGETADLSAVLDWLLAEHSPNQVLLGGYSFGSMIAWRLMQSTVAESVSGLWLIAPPVSMFPAADGTTAPTCPTHILHPEQDNFTNPPDLENWRQVAAPAADVQLIPSADHFFSGQHQSLQAAMETALAGGPE